MSQLYPNEWKRVKIARRGVKKWVNWSLGAWVTQHSNESGCHVGYAKKYQGVWTMSPEEAMKELSSLPKLN